jgi:hypothetical protein
LTTIEGCALRTFSNIRASCEMDCRHAPRPGGAGSRAGQTALIYRFHAEHGNDTEIPFQTEGNASK